MKTSAKRTDTSARRSARAATSTTRDPVDDRRRLREQLIAHLDELGYTVVAPAVAGPFTPEVRRRNPYRGSLVYGATVLSDDLTDPEQHKALVFFANRRTKKRATIQLYIAVAARDCKRLEGLLQRLGIRTHAHGGNVHLVVVEDG